MVKTDFQYKDLKNESIKSVKWSYCYTILPRLVSPVTTITLARILDPSIFGLVAIASLVISFVESIRETGLSKAFIQSDEDEKIIFNVVFWLSLLLGLVFYTIIFISAPIVGNFFHSEESTSVIQILGIQMVLSSLSTSHNSLLIRRIDFKQVFKINILPNFTPLFVTIPLAYIGMGVWSLVIGYLSSSIIRTILFWIFIPFRPQFEFNWRIGKKIAHFGFFCSQEAILGWFYVWGDKAIVGKFLDVKQLGVYTIASTVVTTIFSVVFAPLSNISYPAFCRVKNDLSRLKQILYKLMGLTAVIAFPLGVYVFIFADFFTMLIGEKWKGIEFPLSLLAFAASLSWTVTIIIPDAFKAMGRVDIMPKLQSAKLLYTLPAFVIGANYGGLTGFCYAKLGTVMVGFMLFLLIAVKVLNITYQNVFFNLKIPFLSALIIGVTLYFLKLLMVSLNFNQLVSFSILVIVGIGGYLVLSIVFKSNSIKGLFNLGFQIIGLGKNK